MDYLVLSIFLLVAFIGLISNIFGIPGNIIIFADSVLYGWYGGFKDITLKIIILLFTLVVLGEVLEFILGILGSKRHRSSNSAIFGSIVGGIFGAFLGVSFLFGAGAIIGAFVGAFVGAFIVEFYRIKKIDQAIQSGWGAFIGRISGTVAKGVIGMIMVIISIIAVI